MRSAIWQAPPGSVRLGPDRIARRAARAAERLRACTLCGHRCRADRVAGARGNCETGDRAVVTSFGAHRGEERPLSGWRGSGTVFFGGCNLHCLYCQNWEISRSRPGDEVEPHELADIFLELQTTGCHNLNLVSPTHVIAPILAALALALRRGFQLPVVYNTGGYDSPEALALLDGVVDIYMPDMKYADPATGARLSRAEHYPRINGVAVREMHRQVGDLVLDSEGIARRGLLVRHLVLPGGLAGTEEVLRFVAEEISRDTYMNLMHQYRPCGEAHQHPPLDRRLHPQEYRDAVEFAHRYGLRRLD